MTQEDKGKRSKTLSISPGKLRIDIDGLHKKSHNSDGRVVVVTKHKPFLQSSAPASSNSSLTDKEQQHMMEAVKILEQSKIKKAAAKSLETKAEVLHIPDIVDHPIGESKVEVENLQENVQADVEVEPEPAVVSESKARYSLKMLSASQNKVRNLNTITRASSIQEVVEESSNTDILGVGVEVKKEDIKKPVNEILKKLSKFNDEESASKKTVKYEDKKRVANKFSSAKLILIDKDEDLETSRGYFSGRRHKPKKKDLNSTKIEKVFREVLIPDFITLQELSNRMTEKASDLIKYLMKLGMTVSMNETIDADTAELLVTEFGHKAKRITEKELEQSLINDFVDSEEMLQPRSPVVTIMGHVDHGKTSLLDALRTTDIVKGEAGGITQHIGAYKLLLQNGQYITFLDTPGHEAFTAMRMRGARVTDIVVLVVAADDGIKAQTIEAINHAKAAQVPIIVAVNKMDKPDANIEAVKNSLFTYELVPDDMGGDVLVIPVSAKEGTGLDKLEEAILLQAEMLNLRANPARLAKGTVVEAKIDKSSGVIATLLVQHGTLRTGDIVAVSATFGKIRALINDKGQSVKEATPSTPIEILGLNQAPVAGDEFVVVRDERTAKQLISLRLEQEKNKKICSTKKTSLDQLFMNAKGAGVKYLPVVIKGDVHGSIDAIQASLGKIGNEEIAVKVLHSGVGAITESDVTLASASKAIIVGFNVRANAQARDMVKKNGVNVKYYSIIYNLLDDIKSILGGMLSPVSRESILGYAEVRQVFSVTKIGKIAGCYVTEGIIKRNTNARVLRDDIVMHDGKFSSLKRFKDDVKEVKSGFECGISFENYDDIQEKDRIEVYEILKEQRVL